MIRLLYQNIRLPFLLLGLTEIMAFATSVYVGTNLRLNQELGMGISISNELDPFLLRTLIFAVIMVISMMAMGLYTPDHVRLRAEGILLRIAAAYLIGTVILSLIFYIIPELHVGRGIFMISTIVSLGLVVSLRFVFLQTIDRDRLKRRVLVYGSGARAQRIAQYLQSAEQKPGLKVLGFVHVEGDRDILDPALIRYPKSSLVDFAKKRRVDEIVVAVDDRRISFPIDDLLECRMKGIDVRDLPTFLERETGKISLELITPSWLIFSDGFRHSSLSVYIKTTFDLFLSSVLFLLTLPVMILTAIAIKLEGGWKGRVLYRQVRVGQAERHFEIYKFRSMVENAESDGQAQWAAVNDPRVTRVGAIIRKFRIDELPQILNVLRGEMSFVGPRPERPEFIEALRKKFPYYSERHHVKPGITGWAQLKYPYGDTDRDAMEKLKYDLYYAKHYSLLFDLLILILTVEVILFRKGAR